MSPRPLAVKSLVPPLLGEPEATHRPLGPPHPSAIRGLPRHLRRRRYSSEDAAPSDAGLISTSPHPAVDAGGINSFGANRLPYAALPIAATRIGNVLHWRKRWRWGLASSKTPV